MQIASTHDSAILPTNADLAVDGTDVSVVPAAPGTAVDRKALRKALHDASARGGSLGDRCCAGRHHRAADEARIRVEQAARRAACRRVQGGRGDALPEACRGSRPHRPRGPRARDLARSRRSCGGTSTSARPVREGRPRRRVHPRRKARPPPSLGGGRGARRGAHRRLARQEPLGDEAPRALHLVASRADDREGEDARDQGADLGVHDLPPVLRQPRVEHPHGAPTSWMGPSSSRAGRSRSTRFSASGQPSAGSSARRRSSTAGSRTRSVAGSARSRRRRTTPRSSPGCEIIAHQPHQFYISRYPMGREATVSWGGPELIWKNDWPAAILVDTSYTDTSITVRFYSSKLGRKVTTESGEPHSYVPPRTITITQLLAACRVDERRPIGRAGRIHDQLHPQGLPRRQAPAQRALHLALRRGERDHRGRASGAREAKAKADAGRDASSGRDDPGAHAAATDVDVLTRDNMTSGRLGYHPLMAKVVVQFTCSECGTTTGRWLGRCPGCSAFGTLVEELQGRDTPPPGRPAPRRRHGSPTCGRRRPTGSRPASPSSTACSAEGSCRPRSSSSAVSRGSASPPCC